jgi:hypothetical protein
MSEKRVVNVRPNHCELHNSDAGFSLEFFGRTGSGDVDTRYVIHFEFWWLEYLARHLWKAIAHRQGVIDAAKNSMQEPTK